MCNELEKPTSEIPLVIADLDISRVVLNPNQLYYGHTIVIAKKHANRVAQGFYGEGADTEWFKVES